MYRGKRRGSYRRKRMLRKRLRKSVQSVDHSGLIGKYAGYIAKAVSRRAYDTCCTVVTNWITAAANPSPNPPQLNASVMMPFATVFELAKNQNGTTPQFVPFHCLNGTPHAASDAEFYRHLNMYQQYRIKCIKFEFVPTNAYTGEESSLPQSVNYPAGSADPVAAFMAANHSASASVWMVKWPKKNGTFGDFGVNPADPAVNNLFNSAALADPSVIKIPITEKFVLTWKPKVLGFRPVLFRTIGDLVNTSTHADAASLPVAKKFPWTNIVDNFDAVGKPVLDQLVGDIPVSGTVGNVGPYNTAGLRMPMSAPLIGCYNAATNQFVDPASWQMTGRWTMQTVFEFRQKRDRAAGSFVPFNESQPLVAGGGQVAQVITFT